MPLYIHQQAPIISPRSLSGLPCHVAIHYEFIAANVEKKVKFLNSAIESLKKAGLTSTTAMAHALILRADAYLDSSLDLDQALEDVMNAIEIGIDSPLLNGRAWRVVADVKESKGDNVGAMKAISKWAEVNPEFRLKAEKELKRLGIIPAKN
jgi:tetratricopeptide (TPR) repeat protein